MKFRCLAEKYGKVCLSNLQNTHQITDFFLNYCLLVLLYGASSYKLALLFQVDCAMGSYSHWEKRDFIEEN